VSVLRPLRRPGSRCEVATLCTATGDVSTPCVATGDVLRGDWRHPGWRRTARRLATWRHSARRHLATLCAATGDMATPCAATGDVATADYVVTGDVATGDLATGDVVENVNGIKALDDSIPGDSVGNDNSYSILVHGESVTMEVDYNHDVAVTQTGDAATPDDEVTLKAENPCGDPDRRGDEGECWRRGV